MDFLKEMEEFILLKKVHLLVNFIMIVQMGWVDLKI